MLHEYTCIHLTLAHSNIETDNDCNKIAKGLL
jgi:hypothetical protein